MINRKLNKVDKVTICHKNLCVNVTGRYAEAIAAALVASVLLIATTLLLKRLNNN